MLYILTKADWDINLQSQKLHSLHKDHDIHT
jgi:hypothetical protein